ncbi:hypothetical protein FEM33_20175 [Dyadobacter flavalbus]|uniref:Capsule assembly Wzi family protein n=1 Tax=Dyadobacter flavalbus TaxID=2579942 RepID=A0A5M8QPT3_9BACT|nr:hypothetical protein [Dyadobacter flavalbus]KAA6437040.1 hypothetical protein FEM33_20175 [Dyadobacter flavalbus]
MKIRKSVLLLFAVCACFNLSAQDTSRYQLRISVPLLDFPQNKDLPQRYVSMNQSIELANGMYELSFAGIDKLGNWIVRPKSGAVGRNVLNGVLKYAMSLGFSRYGSELPIPLGVWAHEEFHRSVLGVNGIASKNGNWFLSRWDGTVYGISDEALGNLKRSDPNALLYAYTAGIQSEVLMNQRNTTDNFYRKRTFYKNALLLYNAWYVHNYFRFSTSPESDSVKIWAAPHESPVASERDFAGADLTAWAYDMFSPKTAFTERAKFPDGEGVNRRIGFSELSAGAQDYLLKQKKLSLLNFINPAIFFINRIRINSHFAFNFFTQYAPTHFGNDVALFIPVQLKRRDLLFAFHRYSNLEKRRFGAELGILNHAVAQRVEADIILHAWEQPENFLENNYAAGGAVDMITRYAMTRSLSGFVRVNAKTKGWVIGNPYLKSNISVQTGLRIDLEK